MNKQEKPITLLEISEAAQKRVELISREFSQGFEFIKNYPRSVTFFGSARVKENEPYYEKAKNLARRIVKELHYSVVTGGGPGIMEAANRGAFEAGGNSVGLNIELPKEQTINQYITHSLSFHYFFIRKVCLSFSAEAYIFFPGGFGTLDEFLEITTLIQTAKIPRAPIILVGDEYWKHLASFFKEKILSKEMIESEDLDLFTITENESKIIELIKNAPIRLGLKYDQKAEEPANHNGINHTEGPISELSKKHCIPCEDNIEPFPKEKSEEFLKEINQWLLVEDKEIKKSYEFKNFEEAINFINKVAKIAETEGHHPDINLHNYKIVEIKISTHNIGGLSENDFILASKIDEIMRT